MNETIYMCVNYIAEVISRDQAKIIETNHHLEVVWEKSNNTTTVR